MQALDPELRKKLEKTIIEAREVAEDAAEKALKQLGVGAVKKPDYLAEHEAALRRRLRARGRALGDERKSDGAQELQKLVQEVAYEQWHRLLFARFLLENDLLVHPEYNVSLGLKDCEDAAKEEMKRTGERIDGYEIAARYAAGMLPQIFRTDDPVLDLRLATEDRTRLKRFVTDLAPATFHADDALGWVYQFWQAKRKDEVNASGVKIGADELPSVTQLFTEEYMVRFLLENTLGAWWVARHPNDELPVEMPYLRFRLDGTPAAGRFEGWPDRAAELKVMDPCMGSGHFLVAALHILVPMRMSEDDFSVREAIDHVLSENLHGLEVDLRCTQITAFALALSAWTYSGTSEYRKLPSMNLACSGLAPTGKLDEWIQLAGDDERLQNGMRRLWTLFQDAPTLGSLIDPGQVQDDLMAAGYAELQPLLMAALEREEDDEDTQSQEVVAYGITKAAELLRDRYHLVATNVPYLAMRGQNKTLLSYAIENYPNSKYDLATVFLERSLSLCLKSGSAAVVVPQNWQYLISYRSLREHQLSMNAINFLGELGPKAFSTPLWDFNVGLFVISHSKPSKIQEIVGIDVADLRTPLEKAEGLRSSELKLVRQLDQLKNPDARISLDELGRGIFLSELADGLAGILNGDTPRFISYFWEHIIPNGDWQFLQSTVSETCSYGGRSKAIFWESGEGQLRQLAEKLKHRLHSADRRGNEAWGKTGIAISLMNQLPATIYSGDLFDSNMAVILPKKEEYVLPIWAFCSSAEYNEAVRRIDKKLNVTNATLVKVPFELEYWQAVAKNEYPNGLPKPQSNDPTQWLFHGHPVQVEDPNSKFSTPLHVAIARLVGYRWPAELDEDIELADEARALVGEAATLDLYADSDGIVCLPPVNRERPAVDRLQDLLRAAYGGQWSAGLQQKLLEREGVKRGGLERWLRDKFFQNHSQFFGHRPFVWHIWDGRSDGFGALVNYHKLDRAKLERLVYTYLGEWIGRQRQAVDAGEEGADGRLAGAKTLQRKLKLILEGEPPYDIFVRWKPVEERPIGWEPDLNDGVLVNIWPFVKADVLRYPPKIKWTKDRGKNPEGEPWGPERYNRYEDLKDKYKLKDENGKIIKHLTNEVKRKARAEAERRKGKRESMRQMIS